MVEVTLQFDSEESFEQELRGVFEVIAHEPDNLSDGNYGEIMEHVATQYQTALDRQVIGWFFNGDDIITHE